MGYTQDSVSAEIWAFLLTLQPGDMIGDDLRMIYITQRAFGEEADFRLSLRDENQEVDLVEWLSGQSNLSDVWAHRYDTGDYLLSWNAGNPTRGYFYGPSAQIVELNGSLLEVREEGASAQRSLGEAWEFVQDEFVDKFLKRFQKFFSASNIASADAPAGSLDGDVRMRFSYYDALTANYTVRTVWLRYSTKSHSLRLIKDRWTTSYPRAR